MSRFIPIAVFLVLILFFYVGLQMNPNEKESPLINKAAPSFSLPNLANPQQLVTEKMFQGQVSLLNIWASWCVSCRYEHPLLMALAKQNKVAIYGLNYKDTASKAEEVLTRSGNPYLINAMDTSGRAGIDWGLTGTPETFIIDKQGIIRYKHIGPLTEEALQTKILPLIEKLQKS